MADTKKFDPSKLFVAARLFKDSNEAGSPLVDEKTGEWSGGRVQVTLLDSKTATTVASTELMVTRNKYLAWREDFDLLSTEDVIKEYFKDVDLDKASNTELQKEAAKSEAETKLRTAEARIKVLEDEAKARDEEAKEETVDKAKKPVDKA